MKYSSCRLLVLLKLCLTSLIIHAILPDSMISVILVPIIKDKTRKISSKDNYRPIALSSIVSTLLENIILNRISHLLLTNTNQFGFKKHHGTDQCIYVLKEAIDSYSVLNSSVFTCFLDASKAFDRINHDILFDKLLKRGVPYYIVRIIIYWYVNQTMSVKWGGIYSDTFTVSNGVRQGSILSPFLFNIYVDDLSSKLNSCKTGCYIAGTCVNHLMYADDLVLISPSVVGLNKLLHICEEFGITHDIKYNPKKSAILIFRSKRLKGIIHFPEFRLNDDIIGEVNCIKYLGHFITQDLTDDKDIERQCRQIYVQGNIIIRKFYMCSLDVKVKLFKTYCTPLYTAQLWWNYKKVSINKLYRAYHNVFKMFLGVSKFESTSTLCVLFNVPCCAAVIRNLLYRFITRRNKNNNVFIDAILKSNLFL